MAEGAAACRAGASPPAGAFRETDLLRCVAILLITNSHLDPLYPYPQVATGGSLGNALFFLVSGYGLMRGSRRAAGGFLAWYRRRILRIYPTMIPVVLLFHFGLERGWRSWPLQEYFASFIWPTPYWFIAALMVFYLLFYLVMRLERTWAFPALILLLGIPYGYLYLFQVELSRYTIEESGPLRLIFYFQLMLFGGWLAGRGTGRWQAGHGLLLLGLLLAYGLGGSLFAAGLYGRVQSVIHLLTFPIVYLLLTAAQSSGISQAFATWRWAGGIVSTLAAVSLEIYLLQYFIYSHSTVRALVFPLNVAVFWVAVLSLAVLLARTTRSLTSKWSMVA